ncbi:hypothetical protein BGX26_009093 [Mortierella sp. AD094]|nr:hypothetical protein BGX26_009093 [Mortierella sp. AD094]
MTFLSLKAASTLVLALAVAQAAPLAARSCSGAECNQSVNSGNVQLGSTTNITPITDITPITRYQPIVQAYAPIVHSECDTGLEDGCNSDYGDYDYSGLGRSDLGYSNYGYSRLGYSDIGNPGLGYYGQTRHYSPIGGLYGRRRFLKRSSDDQSASQESGSGSLLFNQFQSPDCQAGQEGCETSVPAQNVDLGSHVSIQPTNQVYPSTTYQNHVQSLDANIDASEAQSSNLPQQKVDLGSNVSIQPTTKVLPQTTYQPSVNQLTTSIQAAPQQDQSLPQSSVQLGSHVSIAPSVQVHPLTTFQSSITSLPFIINSEPCTSDISSLPSSYGYSSTSSLSSGQPYDYSSTSSSDASQPYGYNKGSSIDSSSYDSDSSDRGYRASDYSQSAGYKPSSDAGCA